jgi:CDP-paratose 2-epimerase
VDSSQASLKWNWKPEMKLDRILEEIARHAEGHPEWLDVSAS